LILPLASSGIPIDLLLRITVQSIGGLSNAAMLGGSNGNGSPGFFELLAALRRLQLAGELSIDSAAGPGSGHVSLRLGVTHDPATAVRADIERSRMLLSLRPGGATKPAIALVGVETRPVVIIHAAKRVAGPAYASVSYRATRF
jgi:hypothetical protein